MVQRLKNIKTKEEIIISDEHIIRNDDDYISIQIGNGFSWNQHAHTCKDCKKFLSSFGKNDDWILINDDSGKIKILELTNIFGSITDYFSNLDQFECSSNFFGTRIKIKVKDQIPATTDEILKQESQENYELCHELQTIKDSKSNNIL